MSQTKKPSAPAFGGAKRYTAGHPMATFKRILSYFKPYKGRIILAGIALVLATIVVLNARP